MGRTLKAAFTGVVCVFGLLHTAFLLWDAVAFRPHLPEINHILAEADLEDQQLTPTIHRLLEVNVRSVSASVGDMLCWQLDPRPGSRHGTRALWALSLKLHFDRDERNALLATLAWNGTDRGLDRQARRMYGRSLSRLTDSEAAVVVAWTHAPSYYLRRPKLLQQRAESLLRQL